MFRDNELRYVLDSVLLAWTIAILLGAYEIFIDRADTVLETVVAVITGAAAATGMTVLNVATGEVFMVLYRRVNERRLAVAREEGREEERRRLEEEHRRLEEEHRRLEEERRRLREWYANLAPRVQRPVASAGLRGEDPVARCRPLSPLNSGSDHLPRLTPRLHTPGSFSLTPSHCY